MLNPGAPPCACPVGRAGLPAGGTEWRGTWAQLRWRRRDGRSWRGNARRHVRLGPGCSRQPPLPLAEALLQGADPTTCPSPTPILQGAS